MKQYTFTKEEMLLIRDGMSELTVQMRYAVAERKIKGEAVSPALTRRLALCEALLTQFKTDCAKPS